MDMLISRWKDIDWTYVKSKVFKWQQEIYIASKANNIKQVRMVQHKLLASREGKLLAVRIVTQDNTGKVTAGVDGVKSLTPSQRISLAGQLRIVTKAMPLRRVWIPKPGTTDKRPLGIPTIRDRSLQALMKLALEPEWEARFEPNSYGFRPGRNAHDAVKSILDATVKGSKYVLDADIAKCFDNINHTYLLKKIGLKGAYARQIKYWLESGVLDGNTFQETSKGTPQGGVISPLLANIALHGLETHLKSWISGKVLYSRTGTKIKPSRNHETLHIVRYADDFVILHKDKGIILEARSVIQEFLIEVGLELSAAKTRMSHTLELNPDDTSEEGFDGKVGFNFLGFTIKQFKSKHRSAKATTGELLGFKTLIYPSEKSMLKYQTKLHELILMGGAREWTQETLIKKLNPIIRGWSSYFGVSDANTTDHLGKVDYLLYLKLRRWAKRKIGTSGKSAKYWHRSGTRKWVFEVNGVRLLQHIDYSYPINSYVKVRGDASPYDPLDSIYWAKRLFSYPGYNTRVKTLLKKQKGCCKICGLAFWESDVMEVDHIKPLSLGGKDEYNNLQLVHRHCHHAKTARERAKP